MYNRAMTRIRWVGIGLLVVAGLTVALLSPPYDPLAQAELVAMKVEPSTLPGMAQAMLREGLLIGLHNRGKAHGKSLSVVSESESTDVVVEVRSARLVQGELRWDERGLTGRLQAVCTVTEQGSGRSQTYDLQLLLQQGELRASLTPRRFWQFWKR